MKILGIIPARYASCRFPGKPLAKVGDQSMIQRVYQRCEKAERLTDVIVATDDTRIATHVKSFGGKVIMTSEFHETGTDRCAEALALLADADSYDYIINIRGNEPFIALDLINALCDMLDYKTEIATVVKRIEKWETLEDTNVVKVVLTMRKQALYFSRQAIPFVWDVPKSEWLQKAEFYKHIGIYAYRNDVLRQIVKLPLNVLEQTERLEQLRWLGYGYKIYATETQHEIIGIETPEDLKKLNLNKEGQ